MRLTGCGCGGDHSELAVYEARRLVRSLSTHQRRARLDPTRTTTIRRAFLREVDRRFATLRRLVVEAVEKRDVLGLDRPPSPVSEIQGLRVQATAPGEGAFEFLRAPEKVAAFMEWLREAARDEILDVRIGTPMRSAAQQAWSNVYIQSAYQRGAAQAASQLAGRGVPVGDNFIEAAFMRPFHADRVGLIYTRVYDELRGITEEMDRQISRQLAQGMAEGLGPQAMARRLADRVDKIGRTRARTLARTETISAHADASLNVYEEAGVQGVSVMAELTTAQDDQVCPECAALEASTSADPIPIAEARGMIPVHPNCRCAFLPVVLDPSGLRLD